MEMESLTKNAARFSMTQRYHSFGEEASSTKTTTTQHPPLHFEVDKDDDDDDENNDHHTSSRMYHRHHHHSQMCDDRSSSSSSSSSRDGFSELETLSPMPLLSQSQAIILLIKGNLGPGSLNLPNAFASIGWKWATCLFAFIALQGIYSMWLLVDCKNTIEENIQPPEETDTTTITTRQQRQRHGSTTAVRTTPSEPLSFMDVAAFALGKPGCVLVEFFLVILQGGVCCVFLSLIATNLVAWIPSIISSQGMAIVCVTIVLHGVVLLRFLSDLTWLSATANAFMMIAIFTATIAGITSAFHNHANSERDDSLLLPLSTEQPELREWFVLHTHRRTILSTSTTTTTSPVDFVSNMATFVSDMFFAFEGIGLVLPIENSYTRTTTMHFHHHHHRSSSTPSFSRVLIRSMMITTSLFLLIGIPASIGFPDIASGSVTAYLEQKYPHNAWYSLVNILVMMAVLFTFPLQLTPAIQVLDRWLDHSTDDNDSNHLHCCKGGCCSWLLSSCGNFSWNHRNQPIETSLDTDEVPSSSEHVIMTHRPTENHMEERNHHDDVLSIESASVASDDEFYRSQFLPFTSRLRKHRWIFRRWLVVLTCATIVYLVGNNLGLLIALFGAVGQTGLAGMPCAIHLALQRQGIAPKMPFFRTVIDYGILGFCGLVMIMGVTFAVNNIIKNDGS
jgi:amino acid permease